MITVKAHNPHHKPKRKKTRSPKQKAATKRMIAAGRRKRSKHRKNPSSAMVLYREPVLHRTYKPRPVGAKTHKRKAASTVRAKRKTHRKKPRSRAQKAATAKMIRGNKRGRRPCAPKRRRAKRRTSKRRALTHRRHVTHHAAPRKRARKRKPCSTRKFHSAPDWMRVHHHKHRVRGHIRRTNPSHHRNPKVSTAMELLLGAALGVGVSVGSQFAARTLMPAKQQLAGHVAAGIAVIAAISLAKKRPILAGGLAAGAIAGDIAPMLSAKVEMLASPTVAGQKLGAIRLQGLEYIGAVQANTMGKVANAQSFRMGALQMGPYDMGGIQNTPGPFGY